MSITIKYKNDNEEYKFNSFEKIKKYDNVVHIYCWDHQLNSLPELPDTLECLYCNDNQLTSLSKLPDSLQYLFCGNNQLTSLPELPNSLQTLYCKNNQFIEKQKNKYFRKIIYL